MNTQQLKQSVQYLATALADAKSLSFEIYKEGPQQLVNQITGVEGVVETAYMQNNDHDTFWKMVSGYLIDGNGDKVVDCFKELYKYQPEKFQTEANNVMEYLPEPKVVSEPYIHAGPLGSDHLYMTYDSGKAKEVARVAFLAIYNQDYATSYRYSKVGLLMNLLNVHGTRDFVLDLLAPEIVANRLDPAENPTHRATLLRSILMAAANYVEPEKPGIDYPEEFQKVLDETPESHGQDLEGILVKVRSILLASKMDNNVRANKALAIIIKAGTEYSDIILDGTVGMKLEHYDTLERKDRFERLMTDFQNWMLGVMRRKTVDSSLRNILSGHKESERVQFVSYIDFMTNEKKLRFTAEQVSDSIKMMMTSTSMDVDTKVNNIILTLDRSNDQREVCTKIFNRTYVELNLDPFSPVERASRVRTLIRNICRGNTKSPAAEETKQPTPKKEEEMSVYAKPEAPYIHFMGREHLTVEVTPKYQTPGEEARYVGHLFQKGLSDKKLKATVKAVIHRSPFQRDLCGLLFGSDALIALDSCDERRRSQVVETKIKAAIETHNKAKLSCKAPANKLAERVYKEVGKVVDEHKAVKAISETVKAWIVHESARGEIPTYSDLCRWGMVDSITREFGGKGISAANVAAVVSDEYTKLVKELKCEGCGGIHIKRQPHPTDVLIQTEVDREAQGVAMMNNIKSRDPKPEAIARIKSMLPESHPEAFEIVDQPKIAGMDKLMGILNGSEDRDVSWDVVMEPGLGKTLKDLKDKKVSLGDARLESALTRGFAPGQFYMMGALTDPSKSAFAKINLDRLLHSLNEDLNKVVDKVEPKKKVFLSGGNKEMIAEMTEMFEAQGLEVVFGTPEEIKAKMAKTPMTEEATPSLVQQALKNGGLNVDDMYPPAWTEKNTPISFPEMMTLMGESLCGQEEEEDLVDPYQLGTAAFNGYVGKYRVSMNFDYVNDIATINYSSGSGNVKFGVKFPQGVDVEVFWMELGQCFDEKYGVKLQDVIDAHEGINL